MAESRFYGWKLIAAFWVIAFINLGFVAYGVPVMHAHMALDFHLTRFQAGLPYSFYTVFSGAPAPFIALLIARIGVRRIVSIGSLLIVAAALAMATVVQDVASAVLAAGVVLGLGVVCGGPLGIQPGIVQWFVRRRSVALAVVYSAGGVAGLIAAQWVLEPIVAASHGNWRLAWWLMAALAAIAFVIAAVFIRDRPSDLGQVPDGIIQSQPTTGPITPRAASSFITREDWTYGEVLHSAKLWILVLALCGGSAAYTLFLAEGILHMKDLGHSAATASHALSVMTGSTLLGKLALGLLGDRVDPRYIWACTMAVFGVGLVIVVDARALWSVYTFAVCIGMGFGGGLVCMMAVLSNYYGPKVFASIAGLAALMNTVVSFFAPLVGGRIRDELGTYAPTFYFLAGWCFLAALALFLVRPPVRRAAAAPAVAVSH